MKYSKSTSTTVHTLIQNYYVMRPEGLKDKINLMFYCDVLPMKLIHFSSNCPTVVCKLKIRGPGPSKIIKILITRLKICSITPIFTQSKQEYQEANSTVERFHGGNPVGLSLRNCCPQVEGGSLEWVAVSRVRYFLH